MSLCALCEGLQFIAAHNLRDTGAVASARAAEIYGLEILMDGIQVCVITILLCAVKSSGGAHKQDHLSVSAANEMH